MTEYTFIYSSPCKQALENLINCVVKTFSTPRVKLDDLFYTGVFCDNSTYINYPWTKHRTKDAMPIGLEAPDVLINPFSTDDEKVDFVESTINDILKGKIEKPDWMLFVEETSSVNEYDQAPSTYLRLVPKHLQYKELSDAILAFLYSPSWMSKLVL